MVHSSCYTFPDAVQHLLGIFSEYTKLFALIKNPKDIDTPSDPLYFMKLVIYATTVTQCQCVQLWSKKFPSKIYITTWIKY